MIYILLIKILISTKNFKQNLVGALQKRVRLLPQAAKVELSHYGMLMAESKL